MTEVDDRSVRWVVNAAPTSRWPALRLHEVWRHRELVYFIAARDVRVRYKQAALGVAWALVQPVLGAVMFTVLFHRLADVDVGDTSYFAFALAGYGAWNYFSVSVASGTSSLLVNAELLSKVAFPRIVAPVSALLPGLIDLAVGLVATVAVAGVVGDLAPARFPLLVPGLALLALAAAGPVFLLSALVVRFRDVVVIVAFAIQLLLFGTPVAYPPDLVPAGWRTVVYLNPVSGSLGLLRAALVGTDLPSAPQLALSSVAGFTLVLGGLAYFRAREREFADII